MFESPASQTAFAALRRLRFAPLNMTMVTGEALFVIPSAVEESLALLPIFSTVPMRA